MLKSSGVLKSQVNARKAGWGGECCNQSGEKASNIDFSTTYARVDCSIVTMGATKCPGHTIAKPLSKIAQIEFGTSGF